MKFKKKERNQKLHSFFSYKEYLIYNNVMLHIMRDFLYIYHLSFKMKIYIYVQEKEN
jgi:hypothetical protein